jgi:putative ABC transport system permease protein
LLAAIAGVAFANVLVFIQLGLSGSLEEAVTRPYRLFDPALLLVSATDSDGLDDGSNIPRARLYEALAHPEVVEGTGLWFGRTGWLTEEGDTASLAVFGLDPGQRGFLRDDLSDRFANAAMVDTAIVDDRTRFVDMAAFVRASSETPVAFELHDRRLRAVGTFSLGGGFAGDGGLLVSEQTFFRILPGRSSAAPSHLLLRLAPPADADRVAAELTRRLGPDVAHVRPIEEAARTAARVQLTQRPTGIIFGFGVLIGVIVGVVIAYQVLASDVTDHLSEYATFKAMGYGQGFFVGLILEEALVLGVLGFVPGIVGALVFYEGLAATANIPIFMTSGRAVAVFVGTLASCAMSGVLAMRRLRGADPAELF